ncbi:MAG: PTS sugar transporter [Pseudomonadota bacterium]
MVGAIVVTHCRLGQELVCATEFIVGKIDALKAVSVDPARKAEELRGEIEAAVRQVDRGEGVLILTDMFGGTPSNISLSFLEEGKVEIITGVNLPMIIRFATEREGKSLAEVSESVKSYGRRSISQATEILQKKV